MCFITLRQLMQSNNLHVVLNHDISNISVQYLWMIQATDHSVKSKYFKLCSDKTCVTRNVSSLIL